MKKNSNIMQFNKTGKVKFVKPTEEKNDENSKIVIELVNNDDLLISISNCNIPDVMDMVTSAMNTFFSQSNICKDDVVIANMLKSDFCLQFMNSADLTIDDLIHFIANQAVSQFIKDYDLEDFLHKKDKKQNKKKNNTIDIDKFKK